MILSECSFGTTSSIALQRKIVGIFVSIFYWPNLISKGLQTLSFLFGSLSSYLKLFSIMLRAKSSRNQGILTLLSPICLVTSRKSEKGESTTKPFILCNCDLADIEIFELSAKLIEQRSEATAPILRPQITNYLMPLLVLK